MSILSRMMDCFWEQTGYTFSWKDRDIFSIGMDPLVYPVFGELRNACISLINTPLSEEESDAFLFCMALDAEDERILDACKEQANTEFLHLLLSKGVSFVQSDTRWQMAELLRKDVPDRQYFLQTLLSDSHPYVRKRASNIVVRTEA